MPAARREIAVGERGEGRQRRAPHTLGHGRELRVDVDRGPHARGAGNERVAHALDHPSRVAVEHSQVGHGPDDTDQARRPHIRLPDILAGTRAKESTGVVRGSMDVRASRDRRGHRLGRAQPAREAQRDEPDPERGDGRGAARARCRRQRRRARADGRRRRLVGRHGSEGVLPRGRRRARARAAPGAPRRGLLAVAPAAHLCEADHRDGQRLVLRRRLHAARRLRPGHRRRRGDLRPVRDQLGHPAGQRRQQGALGHRRLARRVCSTS